jgi:hypothetical protein
LHARRASPPPARVQERVQRHENRPAPASRQARPAAQPSVRQPTAAARVQPPAATAPNRQQLRAERALQQRENRALRALPPKQRAARQQQIQNARQQRAQQRQQATPNTLASPNRLAAPNAALTTTQARGQRRNGAARITPQAAQQGRFAAPFAARALAAGAGRSGARLTSARATFAAPRQAWSRGQRAGFVPWYGPVFWPYAYADIFDYTFWPDGYDDGYWAYAYDDFFDGVFWGQVGPPQEYVIDDGYAPAPRRAPPSYAAVQELCKQPGSGITAWPFADIEKKVGLNDEQKQLLGDVRSAAGDAAATFKASCAPDSNFPLTPTGRLDGMTARLQATLGAVETVRPPLEKFYASLSDEQKERFNELGPKTAKTNDEAKQALPQEAKACTESKPGLTNLPIEKIEDAVKPTDAQEAGLKDLEDATGKAVAVLEAACPQDTPITPPGRLEAMETRLKAMIEAANTVKPALGSFYGSLSAEQKARFNRIGRDLAQTTGANR